MKKVFWTIGFISSISFVWGQTEGDYLFDYDTIHTIQINFTQPNWWDTMSYNKEYGDTAETTIYIPATVIIDGEVLDSTGVRFKGHTSYYYNPTVKRSFKLDFNKYRLNQIYDGLKKVNINCGIEDPTMVREKLYLDILRRHNLPSPRCSYTKLFINGQYWGLYYIIEQVNRGFLQDRFENNDWNLFRGDNKKLLTLTNGACADLTYRTNMQDYYDCYELKTNKISNDWTDLVYLTDIINNTPDSDFKDSLETVLHTNSFIGAWAAGNIMTNKDGYWAEYPSNYYVYHNSTTQLFEWISWDVNRCNGLNLSNIPTFEINRDIRYIWPNTQDHPLTVRMIAIPDYEEVLVDYMCKIVEGDFNPDTLFPIIDSLADAIRPHIYTDTNKYFSNVQFENNLESTAVTNIWGGAAKNYGLKWFITARYNSLTMQMDSLGCPNLVSVDRIPPRVTSTFRVSPNPVTRNITVESLSTDVPLRSITFQVINLLGREVEQEMILRDKATVIHLGRVPKGIYIYLIGDGNRIVQTGKLIKL